MARFIYIIVPVVATLVFGGYYFGVFHKAYVAEEARIKAEEERQEEKEREEKRLAEAKAAQEQKERAEAKKREEAKKAEDRRLKQEAEDNRLREMMLEAETKVANLSKEYADLEVQLLELRRQREAAQRRAFDLRREVELMNIDRRNAEIEIQLNTEKVASRVEASTLVEVPIFPSPTGAQPNQPAGSAEAQPRR